MFISCLQRLPYSDLCLKVDDYLSHRVWSSVPPPFTACVLTYFLPTHALTWSQIVVRALSSALLWGWGANLLHNGGLPSSTLTKQRLGTLSLWSHGLIPPSPLHCHHNSYHQTMILITLVQVTGQNTILILVTLKLFLWIIQIMVYEVHELSFIAGGNTNPHQLNTKETFKLMDTQGRVSWIDFLSKLHFWFNCSLPLIHYDRTHTHTHTQIVRLKQRDAIRRLSLLNQTILMPTPTWATFVVSRGDGRMPVATIRLSCRGDPTT